MRWKIKAVLASCWSSGARLCSLRGCKMAQCRKCERLRYELFKTCRSKSLLFDLCYRLLWNHSPRGQEHAARRMVQHIVHPIVVDRTKRRGRFVGPSEHDQIVIAFARTADNRR